ncbi:aminotransferase class V-fold PLP-dependent enzyme [Sphingomonas sp. HF-S4]|uniref:Aminotransferase class V-fold PLP-dependent enzyme n=1 Tax=Sphingomonas agrestis TaxID=3080540 RepID=A0ABU3Y8M9_9SPHN|nr:aminotransferase class V-fold PLP-dependent enzyme [Sphingomonas sp. HF-S4]MDV3457729.1 aminotransferase class V-fold PLP-dependent enzyme [Sphingomonas sp. HF-S4]
MTASYKHLFQRAIAAAPERLHFAAHSHHLWPDASYLGQLAAWEDGVRLADRKWERVMGEIWPAAQGHVAAELGLPDPSTVVFAPNSHELLLRIVSALPRRPLRILATDGEFHSFRRQSVRWEEAGTVTVERVPLNRIVERACSGDHDLVFVSQVQFGTGHVFEQVAELAALARPEGPWVVIDGYHGFMAMETDLSAVADRVFYLAGGYKYAMAGEGCAFLHAPPGFGSRPEITGWYAEFDDLSLPPGRVGYAPDARRFLGATFDPSGIYRFVAVRDMLRQEGLRTADIAAHAAELRDALLARLPIEAELLNPGSPARFVALRSPHAAAWKAALEAQDVIVDVRGDVLRIGFGLYQDARDLEGLIWTLERL